MDKPQSISFRVGAEAQGQRFDVVLHQALPHLSRTFCQRLIRHGHATVNRDAAKASRALHGGDEVTVVVPPPRPLELQPKDIPLVVLFEDNDLLVINKPPGLVVHPAAGNQGDTLVHALLHHCRGKLSGIGGVTRPGIVHRLDKDTSGCLVVAKNDMTHRALVEQFQGRDVWKEYVAFVWGNLSRERGRIEAPIGRSRRNRQKMAVQVRGAKSALTEYEVVERFRSCDVVRVRLHTGRTHQVRVHFASMGHPIVGDVVYGRKRQSALAEKATRQMLHAHRLGFEHPRTKKLLELTAPWPSDMKGILGYLRKEDQSENRSAMARSTSRMSASLNPLR